MSVKAEVPSHARISPAAVHEALGSAATLDELLTLLEADDELVQAIGWREGLWCRSFAGDLCPVGDYDWELLSGDPQHMLVLYLDEVRWQ